MTNLPGPYEDLVVNRVSTGEPQAKSPCSELPGHTDLSRSSRINMAGTYNKYWWMRNIVPVTEEYNSELLSWEEGIQYWMSGSLYHTMAHELGHSMGLNHSNEHHGRNKCDESIMNQSFRSAHNYLQPTEIGKIHRNLRMSNIRNFLEEDVFSEVPYIIEENLEISMNYRAYEDIIVRNGVTLTISCELDLPANAKIIAEPDATIIIRDSKVHHRNASSRIGGIILQQEKAFFLKKRSNRRIAELRTEENGQYLGTTTVKKVRKKK